MLTMHILCIFLLLIMYFFVRLVEICFFLGYLVKNRPASVTGHAKKKGSKVLESKLGHSRAAEKRISLL